MKPEKQAQSPHRPTFENRRRMIILNIVRDILHDAADHGGDIRKTIDGWCSSSDGKQILRLSRLEDVTNLIDSLCQLATEYRNTGHPLSRRQILKHIEANDVVLTDESQLLRQLQSASAKRAIRESS